MKAIKIAKPGGPEVLQLCERPTPHAMPSEVLIRVEAAGMARPDILQRKGHYAPPPGASDILGLDIAGTVVESGSASWAAGQRVCAILSGGGYAEYAVAPAEQVLPLPENWSAVEAASLPENLFTVYDNLVLRARLKAGESLLIHGGTSGIGTMAIMLARWMSCVPFVTAGNDEKCAAAVALGAESAIDYRQTDFVAEVHKLTGGRGVDVILDMVGGEYLNRNLEALAVEGRIALIATQGGALANLDARKLLSKRGTISGSLMRPRTPQEKGIVRDRLFKNVWPSLPGKRPIRPLIDATFPLAEAAAAHQRLEEGLHVGKIVLTI